MSRFKIISKQYIQYAELHSIGKGEKIKSWIELINLLEAGAGEWTSKAW